MRVMINHQFPRLFLGLPNRKPSPKVKQGEVLMQNPVFLIVHIHL